MLICYASHWLEYPYKQLPSVWGDYSGCGSNSVTLWKVGKNWTAKKNIKEDLFPLKSLAASEAVSIEMRTSVLWYLLYE